MRKRNAFRPVLGDRLLEGRALLSVVPGSALVESAAKVTAIEAAARAALGERARFDVEVTASIEPGPSGKARPFVPLGR